MQLLKLKNQPFPIFILGSGRCGTTLLQRLLNSYDNVAIAGEHRGYLQYLAEAYYTAHFRIGKKNRPPDEVLDIAIDTLKNHTKWSAWTNWIHADSVTESYRNFLPELLAPKRVRENYHWGFKEIRYGLDNSVINLLLEIFPDSRFVIIIRHPTDTIASLRSLSMGEASTIEGLAKNWNKMYQNFYKWKTKRPKNFYIVRYEDIVAENNPGLSSLLKWLSLPLNSTHTEILQESEGRYESPLRKNGITPVSKLNGESLQKIYTITTPTRRLFNYNIVDKLLIVANAGRHQTKSGTVLINNVGKTFKLNEIGTLILNLSDGTRNTGDIISDLEKIYSDADKEDIRNSTLELFESLVSLQFLKFHTENN